ncbi:MAG: hypothetical protein LWY06_17885 [Firmicutes bacterium]|nr:hypothetical protein [Bacillota bacterium]
MKWVRWREIKIVLVVIFTMIISGFLLLSLKTSQSDTIVFMVLEKDLKINIAPAECFFAATGVANSFFIPSAGGGLYCISVNRTANSVCFSEPENIIYQLQLNNKQISKSIITTGKPNISYLKISPSGKYFCFVSEERVYIFNQETQQIITSILSDFSGKNPVPAWFYNEDKLAVVCSESIGIYDIKGKREKEFRGIYSVSDANISPDGACLAYSLQSPGLKPGSTIGLISLENGKTEIVAKADTGFVPPPSWSSDGKSLYYSANQIIFRMDLKDKKPIKIGKGFWPICIPKREK